MNNDLPITCIIQAIKDKISSVIDEYSNFVTPMDDECWDVLKQHLMAQIDTVVRHDILSNLKQIDVSTYGLLHHIDTTQLICTVPDLLLVDKSIGSKFNYYGVIYSIVEIMDCKTKDHKNVYLKLCDK